MKFGSRLNDQVYHEWQLYYLDYDALKKLLKKAQEDGQTYAEKEELEFVEKIDKELEKVYAFENVKLTDINNRIEQCSLRVAALMPTPDSGPEYSAIQDEINDIADDVNHLAKYSRLNYTGFLKIVKKHDRHTDYVLRPMFMVRLNQCPFWKQNYDPLLFKLSELFFSVRSGGRSMSFSQPSQIVDIIQGGTQTFLRKSTKYFVNPDDVVEIKTAILRHLPVLVYNPAGRQANASSLGLSDGGRRYNADSSITSIYLDNSSFDLYTSKIERAEQAQAVRLRWYGSAEEGGSQEIFVERKVEQEEETGELKDRFAIKDKYVGAYLRGEYSMEKTLRKMKENKATIQKEVEDFEKLTTEIQKVVVENQLQPVVRTFYNRAAFQMPGDARVRISLDTNLSLIREDSTLFSDDPTVRRPDGAWRRPDVDVNFPFAELKEGQEIVRFPYAVLEVKLHLEPNQETPKWIKELVQSELVEEVPRFSKFVHGIATLFENRVSLLPFWLAQLDKDGRNIPLPPIIPEPAPRRVPRRKHSQFVVSMDHDPKDPKGKGKASAQSSTNISEDGSSSTERTPLSPTSGRRSSVHKAKLFGSHVPGNFIFRSLNGLFRRASNPVPASAPVNLPPGVKVPKKVITPVRVEPKVFFANERTFLSWMSLAALMGSFSIALFNAGDTVGRISGILYTLVAITTLGYGLGLYQRRRELIITRQSGPYDDLVGPTVICVAMFFAVGLNAYLKFTVKIKNP